MSAGIDKWLNDLDLSQYADVFAENDIDARVLPLLSGDDLKELGVSLGHRKIILAAIHELVGQQHATSPSQAAREQAPEGEQTPTSNNSQRDDLRKQKHVEPPTAERRHVTVLFADLVGSTELTNRFDPEDMRDLLQNYQDAVAGAVSRYGGYVAKYLGDGLLVFFGWPRAYEDHAIRGGKSQP